ncbi:DNA-processing protein DprA [Helicobacter baculiformis]|uniref:DNA-processing protein DprA n=1 Tax=Helicobacter baculiformis TaxID=427351 RepID=A0ABV7ZGF9_9HELI|nr:DNA-processing protein DprA [Helicobacter baculiformis]
MPSLSHFNYHKLDALPLCLGALKHPPRDLYYTGRLERLNAPLKVAIVGSRSPSQYTQHSSAMLAKAIAKLGGVVVSGGALGVDIIAQKNALPHTIMIAPCSLDRIYPPTNAPTICKIAQEGLILSEYARNFLPYRHSFLERNRLIIALSDLVIIPEANLHSGSMASAKLALAYQKPLFVLPHRLGESLGTQALLQTNKAQAIYDLERFCAQLAHDHHLNPSTPQDALLEFFKSAPTYEQAYARYGDLLVEYELQGLIMRHNGCVVLA